MKFKDFFKPYRTPYENTIEYINNMKRAKSLSQYEREKILGVGVWAQYPILNIIFKIFFYLTLFSFYNYKIVIFYF
jgi:hypothetical protein